MANAITKIAVGLGVGAAAVAMVGAGYVVWRLSGGDVDARSSAELRAIIEPAMTVTKPDGAGPFPAILLVHGCGGRDQVVADFAALAAEHGVVAYGLDSTGPRGFDRAAAIADVCSGAQLWGHERAGDVLVALQAMREAAFVDPTRLAVMGFSHGGWTLMDLFTMNLADGERPPSLTDTPPGGLDGVRAALMHYPYCGFPARSARNPWVSAPDAVDVILVENDSIADETACATVFERLEGDGATVRWEIWSGPTHAFDEPDHAPGSRFVYDRDATLRARANFVAFLETHLTAN
ncbi:MAG: dienelactone hydrolase family protein [Maricaulaceae bacterium]